MCVAHIPKQHTLFFFCSYIIPCMHMSACVGAGGRADSHVCISLNKFTFSRFFIQTFFFHQRIFVNFQQCCILAIVRTEETGACGITQVLSQNWRDANSSFVGPARPGFSSLFNVFCTHSHESSHFPRHPTDALLTFFFMLLVL